MAERKERETNLSLLSRQILVYTEKIICEVRVSYSGHYTALPRQRGGFDSHHPLIKKGRGFCTNPGLLYWSYNGLSR